MYDCIVYSYVFLHVQLLKVHEFFCLFVCFATWKKVFSSIDGFAFKVVPLKWKCLYVAYTVQQ